MREPPNGRESESFCVVFSPRLNAAPRVDLRRARAPPAIIKPLIKIHNIRTDGWGLLSLWAFPGGVHPRVKSSDRYGEHVLSLPLFATKAAAAHCAGAAMLWRIMCSALACCCLNCMSACYFHYKCRVRECFAAGADSLGGIKKQTVILFCVVDGH